MKVISWNIKGAKESRTQLWDYFSEINPDIALFQEVGLLPSSISKDYSALIRNPIARYGNSQ
jgi:exonuclease III